MKRVILLAAAVLMLPGAAAAQTYSGPATILYPATNGDCVRFDPTYGTQGYLSDAGAACGSGSGGVSSFNTRTGAVVPASGDYTFAQIGSTPTTVAGYGITDAVTLTGVQTLTNKTISGAANTLSNIGNGSLTNSSVTFAGRTVSLGGSSAIASTDLSDSTSIARSSSNLGFFAATTSAQLAGVISDETGTGSLVFGTAPSLTTPNLGTPSAVTLTNGTGLPISTGVSGLGTGCATFLGTPSSANFAACLTDETGSTSGGVSVFSNAPALSGAVTDSGSFAVAGCTIGTDVFCANGTSTIGNLNVTSTTVPTNGIYSGSTNQLNLASNGASRVIITSSGNVAAQSSSGWLLAQAAASCTAPSLVPNRGTTTSGFSSDGTKLCGVLAGVDAVDWAAGGETIHISGSASNSPLLFDGTTFTGGSGTTTFPTLLIQPSGTTAVTTYNTSGSGVGLNMASAFAGLFIDAHKGGGSSLFSVDSSGQYGGASSAFVGAGSAFYWNGRSLLRSPADGVIKLSNQAETGFTRLQLGGTTSSFGALQTNGTETDSELADGSARAPFGASNLFLSGNITLTGTIPTVSGTGTPAIATGSTDSAGEVTGGTAATSIIITFAAAKTNAPFCVVTSQTQLTAFAYTISTTAISITETATTGDKVDYVCTQH